MSKTWRPIWQFIATLSLFYSFTHSPSTAQSLTGRWVGVTTEYDLDAFCPLPVYMDFNADSTWQLGLIDESAAPRTGRWARLKNDSLRFNEATYAPELVTLQGDRLRIGRVQPMTFRRFRAMPMKRETVWARLVGQVWQSDSVQFRFGADGRVALRNRRANTQTIHYAEVLALAESAFLVVRGNPNGRAGDIRIFWQVVGNDVGVIRLQNDSEKPEILRWVGALPANESLQSTQFQPCANCYGMDPTFFAGYVNELNKRKLLSLFRQQYKPVDVPDQSGVITLKFVRNCAGEIGPISLQQLDTNYKRRPFDKRVSDQLMGIVRNHLPGSLFGDNDKAPSHDQTVTFTIRLVDGRLTDLF